VRHSFRQILRLAKAAFVEFVWADLRDGMIDLRGLSVGLQATILLGCAVVALCLGLLTQAPALRAAFPLYTSVVPAPGRGLQIPLVLFPLSLFLLTLAWAYLLSGARRAHWLIRLGIFALYALTMSNWTTSLLSSDPVRVAIALMLTSIVLVTFVLPSTRQVSPALFFALMLLCVGGAFVIMQVPLVLLDQASGLPIGKTVLESNLRSLTTVALPLLIVVGFDIADFALHLASWVTSSATTILPRRWLIFLSAAIIVWLLWQSSTNLAGQSAGFAGDSPFYPLMGAAALLCLLWLVWWLLDRLFPSRSVISMGNFTEVAHRVAIVIVLLYTLPLLVSFIYLEVAQFLDSVTLALQSGSFGDFSSLSPWATALYANATTFSTLATEVQPPWQRLCTILFIVAAFILYRRRRYAAGLYLMTTAVNGLWVEITRPGQWLQAIGWSSLDPVIVAWVACLIVWSFLNGLWGKRSLAGPGRLLIALSIVALLRQTDLISSPLAPLFSLTGVAYLAVGMGWDLISSGSWANVDSKALPRISRIFLYLGYILLSIMLVNWAVASHDFTLLDRFTGQAALIGLTLLGYPYLYALLYLLLTGRADTLDFVTDEDMV
jgi:hypothetical protein